MDLDETHLPSPLAPLAPLPTLAAVARTNLPKVCQLSKTSRLRRRPPPAPPPDPVLLDVPFKSSTLRRADARAHLVGR